MNGETLNGNDLQKGKKETDQMSQGEIDEYADRVRERTGHNGAHEPVNSAPVQPRQRFLTVFIYVVGVIIVAHVAFSNFVTMEQVQSLESEISAANKKLEAQEETINGLEQEVSTLERNITLLQDQVRELGGTPNVGFLGEWEYGARYAPHYKPLQ